MRAADILPKATLFEMPYLMSGPLPVALQTDAANLQMLNRIMAGNPAPIQSDADGALYFVPKSGGGEYAYVSKQKVAKIEYYMEFTEKPAGALKHAATQIIIWNRLAPAGLTAHVFFDEMLKSFDTMISDDQQSTDGQRFWLRQMREGLKRGFTIGMIDGTQMHTYDRATDFDEWIRSLDGWGQDSEHWFRVFFITKVNLQPQVRQD